MFKYYNDKFPNLSLVKFLEGYTNNRRFQLTKQGNYTNGIWLLFKEYLSEEFDKLLTKTARGIIKQPRIYSEKTLWAGVEKDGDECDAFEINEDTFEFDENEYGMPIVYNAERTFMCYSMYMAFFLKNIPNLMLGTIPSRFLTYLISDGEFVGVFANNTELHIR